MTTLPWAAIFGAHSFEKSPDTAISTTSQPAVASRLNGFAAISP